MPHIAILLQNKSLGVQSREIKGSDHIIILKLRIILNLIIYSMFHHILIQTLILNLIFPFKLFKNIIKIVNHYQIKIFIRNHIN